MGIGPWQIILILVIVLIIFGAGKLPRVAGDIAKGVKNFKKGLAEDGDTDTDTDTAAAGAKKSIDTSERTGEAPVEKDKAAQG